MTTITLFHSSWSPSHLRQLYPSSFSRSSASSPYCCPPHQQGNAQNFQLPPLLSSHGAIRSLQQSSLSAHHGGQGRGIPGGRGRVSRQVLADGQKGCLREVRAHFCSHNGNSTGGVEELEETQLLAMPSNESNRAAAAAEIEENGGGGDSCELMSPQDLLPSFSGSASRGSWPFRMAIEAPISPKDEALGLAERSSNIFHQVVGQLRSGLFTNNPEAIVRLALLTSVLGLQACSRAWAAGGSEMAQINANSGVELGDLSDIQSGFASAFLLIFFSEIGDKTFFIAALLATRKPGVAVFSGTFGALMAMTVISVSLGRVFHYIDGILPSLGLDTKLPVDDIAAVVLLVYFGVSTLVDAYYMEESGEEQQEAELAIADVGAGGAVAGTVAATFALVFVAEWGDKSFFSTIALAAASSPLGVVLGAIAGHGAATLLAVVGGSVLGNYISERVIAYVGGVLFLVFAAATLVEIVN